MKLAFSSNAFTKYSLIDSIDEISNIGYEGIEIMCDKPHMFPLPLSPEKVDEIKSSLSQKNLAISNLNAFTLFGVGDTYHPTWIEDDPDYRKKRIDHTIKSIEIAHQLGAKNISIEPGGPISYNKDSDEYHKIKKQHDELFLEGINKILPYASQYDVNILVEPEPGLLLENSFEFLEFMAHINSKYVGLNFDVGHFYCMNEDPAELVFNLKGYFQHIHFADIKDRIHNHLIPGLGSINFRDILKSLKKIEYEGFVTVELYPYKDNPAEAAKKSYHYLKNIITELV